MDRRIGDVLAAFQQGRLEEARELAAQLLEASPGSSQLQHLMGLIECRSGRIDTGVEWLQQAVAAEPTNSAFRLMLIRALTDCGRAREALEVTISDQGDHGVALALWRARGEAAQTASEWALAIEAWRRVCAAQRADWRAWSNLGEAFAKSGQWSSAAEALSRAVGLNPREPRMRRNLVSALGHAGEHGQSAIEIERLLAATPEDVSLRLTLARVLADLGRTDESMLQLKEGARLSIGSEEAAEEDRGLIGIPLNGQLLGAAQKLSAEQMDAVRELALLLERTNRIEALRNLLAEAAEAGIPKSELGYAAAVMALRDGEAINAKTLLEAEPVARDPLRWHRLMAKILDAHGQVQSAFDEALAMHFAVPDYVAWRKRGREYRDELRTLSSAIPLLSSVQLSVELLDRPSPAFLVGFPRSGTTLADTFLMGHPATRVLEEVPMLAAAESAIGGMSNLVGATSEQLLQARRAYFELLDSNLGGDQGFLVIDKLPLSMTRLPLINALFPDARVIFAQRHPCDAVLSGFMQSFVLNPAMACFLDIWDAADLYDAAMSVFCRSRERLDVKVHTIVYEELVAGPESTLEQAIDFLRLEWRPELLAHQETVARRGAINTPSYDQVREPLNNRNVGRWRRYAEQLSPVLPKLLPWVRRLGYDK